MSEKTIKPLVSLTTEEVKALALVQGLEVGDKTRQQLMKELKAATSIDASAVEVPTINPTIDNKKIDTNAMGRLSGDRLKVSFPRQDGIDGLGNIVFILNGYRYEIQRDEEVEVPVEVLDAMDTCVYADVKLVDGEEVSTNRKRFAYQMVR